MSLNKRHGTIPMTARMLPAFVVALLCLATAADARTITDSAGRVVDVPDKVTRVFAAGPPASILVYALKPEALLGWPRALRDYEKPYIAAPYRELPETGRLTGRGGGANLERVLALNPDLVIDFGSVRDTYIDLANRVQEQTGFPYLLVNGRFEETAASIRLVGEALGVPDRGEALAADVEATFAALEAVLTRCPRTSARASTWPAARTAWRRGSRARSTPRSSSAPAGATWPTCPAGTAWCRRRPRR